MHFQTFLLFLFLSPSLLLCQQTQDTSGQSALGACGTLFIENAIAAQYPESLLEKERLEASYRQHVTSLRSTLSSQRMPMTYTLPIVVHIIHENGDENIPDSQVLQGVQDLNDAFANVGYYDPNTGVNTNIQFCLAKRTPEDSISTGITRTVSDMTNGCVNGYQPDPYNLIEWDPSRFINIWLLKKVDCQNQVAGFATGTDYVWTGIIMRASYFGSHPYNSATIVHEMGHYLGLAHTFHGGCQNDDCLQDGDRVCDTPPDNSTATASILCEVSYSSCTTDVNPTDPNNPFTTDQPDLNNNYMDYGWLCPSIFTQGQADRMRFIIENARQGLLASNACAEPCTTQVTAAFLANTDSVAAGQTVLFTNQSANATNYQWRIGSDVFAVSQDASHVFGQTGLFSVILEASTDHPECVDRDTLLIRVYCPVEISISPKQATVSPGDPLSFLATCAQGNTILWKVNGSPVGNGMGFPYTFIDQGTYIIEAMADNGVCSVSDYAFVTASSPCGPPGNTFGYRYFSDTVSTTVALVNRTDPLAIDGQGYIWLAERYEDGIYDNVTNIKHCYVAKLTPSGSSLWTMKLSFPASGVSKLLPTLDGGCLLVGRTADFFTTKFYAVKMDSDGEVAWSKILDIENLKSITDGIVMPDGAFVLTGRGSVSGSGHYLLFKISPVGEVAWSKKVVPDGEVDLYPRLVINQYNDMFMSGSAGTKIFILKVNGDGDTQWANFFDSGNKHYAGDLALSSDMNSLLFQGYVCPLTGFRPCDVFAANIGFEGDVLWGRRYLGKYTEFYGDIITPLQDGYIIKIDSFWSVPVYPYNLQKSVYFKINEQGAVIWSKSLTNTFMYSAKAAPGNGLYFCPPTFNLPGFFSLYRSDAGGYINDCEAAASYIETQDLVMYPQGFSIDITEVTGTSPPLDITSEEVLLTRKNLCPDPLPDAVASAVAAKPCDSDVELALNICNSGYAVLAEEVPVAFYDKNPLYGDADLLAVMPLGVDIEPDSCAGAVFNVPAPPNGQMFFIVNDNGSLPPPFSLSAGFPVTPFSECNFFNNLDSVVFQPYAPPVFSLGNDTSICAGDTVVLAAPPGFSSYLWQDGSDGQTMAVTSAGDYWLSVSDNCGVIFTDTLHAVAHPIAPQLELGGDVAVCANGVYTFSANGPFSQFRWQDYSTGPAFTAWQPGTFWVDVWDACGNHQSDTVRMEVETTTIIELGENITACEGGTLTLAVQPTFDTYAWSPPGLVDCSTCPAVTLVNFPGQTTYSVLASNGDGCFSSDTVQVTVLPTAETFLTLTLGPGDTAIVGTSAYTATGQYLDTLTAANGCDSIVHLTLTVLTGTDETGAATGWHVFPNPSGGQFQLNFGRPFSGRLECFNALGEQVAAVAVPEGATTYRADFQHFAKGVYFLRWSAEGFVLTKKIVLD